jgi:hypothetical protein
MSQNAPTANAQSTGEKDKAGADPSIGNSERFDRCVGMQRTSLGNDDGSNYRINNLLSERDSNPLITLVQ